MKIYSEVGKLSNEELEKLILSKLKNTRPEVIGSSSVGEDTATLDLGGDYAVLSSDPITGAVDNLGKLAIYISVNDVSTKSADAVGVLLTLLLPVDTTSDEIEKIMADAQQAAEDVEMDIVGGHTEITDAVTKPVMISTVIGRVKKENMPDINRIEAGDVVAMTKYAGLEGTAILCNDFPEKLRNMGEELLLSGQNLVEELSVQTEGEMAAAYRVGYMHDVTEGGIEGAIWEASQLIGKGMRLNRKDIPVHDATRALESMIDVDIYRLISSGSMLVVLSADKFCEMKRELDAEGILFTKIGEITEKKDVVFVGEEGGIDAPRSDELYSAIAQLQ
ncbi:MAG: AIR synthase-related protein [Peptoniphilus sp.]|nr:AIR synthase-related protein [Peptoniphilus sp.]MDD7363864.1 AIR synthase-related protein [Bacillota bacterium]MDY6044297.1 AIR synthase-related protein [Peptoniphilus sp.]